VYRSLVEFCSLLFEILQCFGKLHDPWRSGFLCVARMDSPHLLNPSKYPDSYVDTQQLCSSFSEKCRSRHSLPWLSPALQFTVGWNINTDLWSKLKLLTRKVVSGVLYPYNSDKTNAQKLEISTKIDVYSYRRTHRHASCSAGVLCRGCGVVTCNIQPSI